MTRAFAVLPAGGAPTGTGRREIEVAEIIQHPQARQYVAAGFLFAVGGAALLAAARQFLKPQKSRAVRLLDEAAYEAGFDSDRGRHWPPLRPVR